MDESCCKLVTHLYMCVCALLINRNELGIHLGLRIGTRGYILED